MILVLGDPPGPAHAPKLANLSRLHASGLPVPPGLGMDPAELTRPEVRALLADLLRDGPVIVRSALAREDTLEASAAGLGLSVPDCRDLAAIDLAAARIDAATRDPALLHYGADPHPGHQLLVQRQVARRWLVVAAIEGSGACVELHGPEVDDALAAGVTPTFTGPLEACAPELRAPLGRLFSQVVSAMPEATALDLELIVDPAGALWLVQARPLARPLDPGWPAFLAEVAPGRAQIPGLPGLWRLDAEHNPAPLSPAHAGVIAWLAERGARSRVLAGWLYDPVSPDTSPPALPGPAPPSPRDLPGPAPPSSRDLALALPGPAPPSSRDLALALRELRTHTDAARSALVELTANLPDADPAALADGLERALEHLRAVIGRHAALAARRPPALAPDLAAPLCLRERAAHLDVLPLAWDIASPVLADMLPTPRPDAHVGSDTPEDPAAAWSLLRELDDHLFALGLAPVRRTYLAAGQRLVLGDAVFLLTPPELRRALLGGATPDLSARREQLARRSRLSPPLALFDGRPVPATPRRRLHGLPAGASVRGPLAQRRDLADLLARPPDPKAIVVLPALTAQAAVALRELALRAVCCEHGGALSHAALMVRELGLSALIGCRGCSELPDGALAELDARLGRLRLL